MPPSPGARVYYIRVARAEGRHRLARELFVGLLEEIEASCAAWARRCVVRTVGIPRGERERLGEELRQELALRLWDEVSLGKKPGWELFFFRALTFAEQHIASALMQQRGYWPTSGKARQQEPAHRLLIRLQSEERTDRQPSVALTDPMSFFSSAELSDLRELVRRLPVRPRTAIVLRYWQDATEGEIAEALGGVTTRTVRNYLRQGHTLLRGWYAECEARRL
jgi:RNA polymerase sigma factor (sigma-70 family)